MINSIDTDRLQRRLGYFFKDVSLLHQALTHRSYGHPHNERLEFLGDSILGFVIGEALFQRYPNAREGELTRLRSSLVKGETLAHLAQEFDLGTNLILGGGERKSGGHRRASILADAVEAIIGAIYLESGFSQCREIVLSWFADRLDQVFINKPDHQKDPKTRLQEWLQSRKRPLPKYELVKAEGLSHEQEFTIRCELKNLAGAEIATGKNRKEAEQQVAERLLARLQEQ